MSVEAERFAIDDVACHDLPDGTVIARNRRTGAQMQLPGEVFNAITHCDAFRTMEEQIAHLAGPQARGREGEIRQILQAVINGGLMLSATEITNHLVPRADQAIDRPAVAAIITCDRPQALARLLASMAEDCDLGRIDRLVVIDDSRSEQSIEANRAALEQAGESMESGGLRQAVHLTPEAASELITGLVRRQPEHEAGIRFLLDRKGREGEVTTGISRNLAQLLGIGQPLLVFDDDVLCTAMEPPLREKGVEFSSRQRGCQFYASDDDWEDRRNDTNSCSMTRHLEVLGHSLEAGLAALGEDPPGPSALEFANPGFARRLEPDSPILVSQCGSYGDPGSAGNEWVALLAPEARAQLGSLSGDITSAEEKRNCWLGRSRTVFEPRANMSQLTGFDNRGYLPPYFPLFRGQDRNFGAMTAFLYPHGLAVDLPFAVPHLPIPRRSWREGHRGFSLPFTLGYFLNDFVTGQISNCGARDISMRNGWLAMMFDDLADSPRDRIIEIAAGQWTRKRIDWMSRLARTLGDSSGPNDSVAGFARQAMNRLRESGVTDFSKVEIKGPPDQKQGEAVLDYWRSAWRDFAAGLRAWPAVREEVVSQPFMRGKGL